MLANTIQIRNIVQNVLKVSYYGTWTDSAVNGDKLLAWRIGDDGDKTVAVVKAALAAKGFTNRVKTTTSPEFIRGGGDTYLRIKAAKTN
jgi:hypothetical protein